jgi:CheY-like chemotaxis protein
LVFLDVDMPGMNGFEVCGQLQATPVNATTPAVFVTALNDFERRAQSRSIGAVDFIAKPIAPNELALKAVMHIIRGRMEQIQ